MGYILICFSIGTIEAANFAFVYLLIYIFILINFFSIYLVIYRTDKSPMLNIVDCVSLLKTNPILSILFSISLLSLAGIPPLAGFFGKCAVFYKLINTGDYYVCFLIILFSVLSVIYYIRLIRMC
jgi:NADH:ubiquinone oxidoreductase subunit 2 (subunit N)